MSQKCPVHCPAKLIVFQVEELQCPQSLNGRQVRLETVVCKCQGLDVRQVLETVWQLSSHVIEGKRELAQVLPGVAHPFRNRSCDLIVSHIEKMHLRKAFILCGDRTLNVVAVHVDEMELSQESELDRETASQVVVRCLER